MTGATPPEGRRRPRRPWAVVRLAIVLLLVFGLGATGLLERLFYVPHRGPTPVPARPPGGELVHFHSRDGTRLTGWLFPAAGRAMSEAPTVLHVHGNAGSLPDHLGFSDFLPAAGFNLFVFDYRGYGESEGRATRRGPLIEDAHAALDVLLAHDDIDPERIALFGQSLGGGIGANVMAERAELRAGVLISVFASWREVASDILGGGSPGPVARTFARWLIRDGHRPDEAVARIERPLLIAHGESDEIIPVRHAHRLAEAAPHAELLLLEGGDHNGLRQTHPGLDRVVVEFLRSALD